MFANVCYVLSSLAIVYVCLYTYYRFKIGDAQDTFITAYEKLLAWFLLFVLVRITDLTVTAVFRWLCGKSTVNIFVSFLFMIICADLIVSIFRNWKGR